MKSIKEMNWWERWLYRWGIIDSEGKLALTRLPAHIIRPILPLTDRLAGKKVRVAKDIIVFEVQIDSLHPNANASEDRVFYWVEKMKKGKAYPHIMLTFDNVIVDGHARSLARKMLGYTTVAAIKLNPEDSEFIMNGGVLRVEVKDQFS